MLPLVYRTDGGGGSRGGAQGARPPSPSLCLDQTKAQRAKNKFWRPGPTLSQDLDDRPHPTPPLPYLKVWIRHWTVLHWIAFRNEREVVASLRSIPSWKSNLCCMLDTNVHWFVCLFVCFWKTKKKQRQWYLQSQMAGFKLSKFILASDAEGNKTKQMKY